MRTPLCTAALILTLVVAGCGSTDDPSGEDAGGGAERTIEIAMQDNKYVPDSVAVEAGETVRFEFTNDGEVTHDAFIGDEAAQAEHEEEMSGDMGGHGTGDTGAVTVEAGETGELTHTFEADEDVLIGCHEPGHYDGGMRLNIDVT
jgi:uncharacterized cupredoxin-like copper-binding protein